MNDHPHDVIMHRIGWYVSMRDDRMKSTVTDQESANEYQAKATLEELIRAPIPMLLWCPECSARHIDTGVFETKSHHTHACQNCGHCWRPAIVPTRGVKFLPGFKND